ncbi:MAG: ribose-phosphate pyrophosphokinase [Bacilli bacterium]|jgi:ribose-phosphate pyrophosphokinase|nr:ribose-phosphate pyrophosphokinase [Bacilli bacterium]
MLKNAIVFSLSANPTLAASIAEKLGVQLGQRTVKRFPSGEILCEPVDSVRGKDVFIIQSTCPPVNENLMEVLIFVDALKRASAREINLIIPYFGYARQDRKARPREPITASLVANLLTTAGVHRVVTVNLHASQIQGFFSCLVDDLTAVPLLGHAVIASHQSMANTVVVSPDHGGVNRARDLAEQFNCSIAIIDKRRNSNLEPEVMNIIGDVKGKRCFMVDDMIDTGRSAVIGATALRNAGAESVSFLTVHPVFSDPCFDLLSAKPFDELYVTDSIPLDPRFKDLSFIKVVSLAPMLAETIRRIETDAPLSAVYEAYADPLKAPEHCEVSKKE